MHVEPNFILQHFTLPSKLSKPLSTFIEKVKFELLIILPNAEAFLFPIAFSPSPPDRPPPPHPHFDVTSIILFYIFRNQNKKNPSPFVSEIGKQNYDIVSSINIKWRAQQKKRFKVFTSRRESINFQQFIFIS